MSGVRKVTIGALMLPFKLCRRFLVRACTRNASEWGRVPASEGRHGHRRRSVHRMQMHGGVRDLVATRGGGALLHKAGLVFGVLGRRGRHPRLATLSVEVHLQRVTI